MAPCLSRYALTACCLMAFIGAAAPTAAEAKPRVLLIVLDGLRPDYVTPEGMPHLHGWGRAGVVFEKHHATFPTVTRVNASSIATGTYPDHHGIADNSVYFPAIEPNGTLSTASRGSLERIEAETGGNLLTALSLGEWLAQHEYTTGVFSSGSHGSAFLLNHKVSRGAIVNSGYVLPPSLSETLGPILGEEPPDGAPNTARNDRVVAAYLNYGLNELDAELTLMWISDPDHTAHKYGMDSPENATALKAVDDALGRIAATLVKRGLWESMNILVTSDHGFSTHTLEGDPKAVIREFASAHQLAETDIIVTGATLYLKEAAEPHLEDLVERLQQTPWAGPLFTRSNAPNAIAGKVPGTLSLKVVRAGHPERAPHIVFSPRWTNDKTGAFAGTVLKTGVAGHGSTSPWDIHNTLIARGPAFVQGRLTGVPSHNTDLAPTICHLLGLAPSPDMEGRILYEGLRERDPHAPEAVGKQRLRTTRQFENGTRYEMEAQTSHYRGRIYLDHASAVRN